MPSASQIEPELLFKRDKYDLIDKLEGESAAITALHHDMKELEFECFEGSKGWQPDLYEELKKYREYSFELWNRRYN